MGEKYLTLGQAARELGVTKARVSQLGSMGTLEIAMVEGRKQVLVASVQAYAQRRRSGGRVPAAFSGKSLTLMSADYEVARLTYDCQRERPFSVVEVLDPARMPLGTVTSGGNVKAREFNDWWFHRSIPDARPMYLAKCRELGLSEGERVSMRGHGLSLSDCYWLLPDGADLEWSRINYFQNHFVGCDEVGGPWLASVGLDSPDNTSEGGAAQALGHRGRRPGALQGVRRGRPAALQRGRRHKAVRSGAHAGKLRAVRARASW